MIRGAAMPGGKLRRIDWRSRRDLTHGHADVRPGLEKDLDDRAAADGLRFDVLDIVDDRGEEALVVGDDAVFHLLRGKAAVVPSHADYRDIDIREDVGGGALQYDRSHQQDDQREYDERIRAPERNFNNPHSLLARLAQRLARSKTRVAEPLSGI